MHCLYWWTVRQAFFISRDWTDASPFTGNESFIQMDVTGLLSSPFLSSRFLLLHQPNEAPAIIYNRLHLPESAEEVTYN
jgi:hypothetical protein